MKKITLIFVFLSIALACFAQQEIEITEKWERWREKFAHYWEEKGEEEITKEEWKRWREETTERNRSIVFSVVEQHAQNYTEGRNFLVFSTFGIGHHFIVIEEDGFFRELRIREDSLLSNIENREPSRFLKTAFNKEIYHTGTRFLDDFPEKMTIPHGRPAYFVFVDKNGNFYGESITETTSPLIDRDVHFYLFLRAAGLEKREREQRWWHRFRFMRRR